MNRIFYNSKCIDTKVTLNAQMTNTKERTAFQTKVAEETATVKLEFRTRDYIFLGAAGILLSIIGPYIYYSGVIYMYIHQYRASEAGSEFT